MNKCQVISCIAPKHQCEIGRSSVEILVGESVFFYVWCGNAVPTPLFLEIGLDPCLPPTFFGQKFSSARN